MNTVCINYAVRGKHYKEDKCVLYGKDNSVKKTQSNENCDYSVFNMLRLYFFW